MSFFKRLFGSCATQPAADPESWRFEGGQVLLNLSQLPELAHPGGAVRLEGKGLPQRLLVLRSADGGLHAFFNKCTHAGRRLDPLPEGAGIRCCSLGKSTFELDGTLVSGSAKKDLAPLKLEHTPGEAKITLG